jgi:hypothetical protein
LTSAIAVTETLPYSMRASGMALFVWCQNATLCANQWINPISLDAAGWKVSRELCLDRDWGRVLTLSPALQFYFVFIATLIFFNVMIYFYFVECVPSPVKLPLLGEY